MTSLNITSSNVNYKYPDPSEYEWHKTASLHETLNFLKPKYISEPWLKISLQFFSINIYFDHFVQNKRLN